MERVCAGLAHRATFCSVPCPVKCETCYLERLCRRAAGARLRAACVYLGGSPQLGRAPVGVRDVRVLYAVDASRLCGIRGDFRCAGRGTRWRVEGGRTHRQTETRATSRSPTEHGRQRVQRAPLSGRYRIASNLYAVRLETLLSVDPGRIAGHLPRAAGRRPSRISISRSAMSVRSVKTVSLTA